MFLNFNFQEQQQQKINLKIVIGGDCFRLSKFPQTYQELDEIVHNKFENKLPESFCYKYEDNDNDSINIESNSDYEAFKEYCFQEKINAIKLRIDSKNFKQYFNQCDQQFIQQQIGAIQSNSTQQNLQSAFQNQQFNSAIGVLVNPYMTLYQNIQNGNKATGNFLTGQSGQNKNVGQNNNQGYNMQTTDSSINQFFMQMLFMQQGMFNISANPRNSSSTINNNQGMNQGNTSSSNININNNTNPANNSLSSQQPILSKVTSEVQNASEQGNQIYTKRLSNYSQSINDQNISFAPMNTKQSNNATFNLSFPNLTTSNKYDIQNLMETDAKISPDGKPVKQTTNLAQIKRTDSMSIEDKDVTAPSISFQHTKQNTQNFTNSKNSANLRQAELTSSNISTNIGTLGSNYSSNNAVTQQLLGVSVNQKLSVSQYTAQSREAYDSNNKDPNFNLQYETSENDFSNINIKRVLSPSPSPPLSQYNTFENSTNNQGQNRISNKPLQISTLRSLQNPQIPCDKCIIWDEELKNKPSKQTEFEKTPTSNTGKDLLLFTPNPECKNCDGSGYLKIEDQDTYNIVQTIMRHKLKESELILKSISVRQQKIEKIIPKENMDWLQTILKTQDDQNSSLKENSIPIQNESQKNKELGNIHHNSKSNMISKNIHLIDCFVCKSQLNNSKYFYQCMTCKQKKNQNDHFFPERYLNDSDFDFILCESCEDSHESGHLLIQISANDITTMHPTPVQNQQNIGINQIIQHIGNQPINNLERSLNVNNNYSNYQLPINSRQYEPRIQTPFTQSMGLFNVLQNNIQTGPKTTFQNPSNYPVKVPTLEQSTQGLYIPPQLQLQQQQSYITQVLNFTNNQEVSQRGSIADVEIPVQFLPKMRSKTDNRSLTAIVRNSIQEGDFQFDISGLKDETQSNNIENIGRHSTNQNAFNNQKKSSRLNDEDEPPTFNPALNNSQKFIVNTISQEQKLLPCISIDEQQKTNIIVSPVISKQQIGLNYDYIEFDAGLQTQSIINKLINNFDDEEQKHDIIDDFQIANQLINCDNAGDENSEPIQNNNNSNKQKQNIESSQEFQNKSEQMKKQNDQLAELTIVQKKVSSSHDINPLSNKMDSEGFDEPVNGSICVKSTYNNTTSKLTQSSYLPTNRTSLSSSMMKPDESRMPQSQYRAKLVNSYCSEVFQDDSVVVFQEILNNGSENWPENVYLKCISGITDNCQYPVIQVNKGELMSMAFPIKIDVQKLKEDDQIKTAWRLYYQQQNEERKFFGPKITIDFNYKKPQKTDTKQNIGSLVQQIVNAMKSIFNKDDQISITEFVKQNRQLAQQYQKSKNEEYTFSKMIIKYVEQYVTYKNKNC